MKELMKKNLGEKSEETLDTLKNCEEVVANHLMQEWVESTKCGHLSLFLRSRLSHETQTVLSGAHVVYSFIIMAVISQVMHP